MKGSQEEPLWGPPPWCAIVVYIFNACRVYANLKPELGGEGWWTTQVVGRGGGTPSAWPGAGMPSYLMPMTGLTYYGTKLVTDQGSGTRGGGDTRTEFNNKHYLTSISIKFEFNKMF